MKLTMNLSNALLTCCLLVFACQQIQAQHPNDDPIRSGARSSLEPFYHGVASGDPLADRVIIWTRVTPTQTIKVIPVIWEMSSDSTFDHILQKKSTEARALLMLFNR